MLPGFIAASYPVTASGFARLPPQHQRMAPTYASPSPSQSSPVQPGMLTGHLPPQQSTSQIVAPPGGQIVYVPSAPYYQTQYIPSNTATYGTDYYAPLDSRAVQEPPVTIPVWTSTSAGGVPVAAVGKSDGRFVANCIVTESNVVPTTMGGVAMTPAGVEMQTMSYGSPQSVFMYPPPRDFIQLVQVMQPPQHHTQHVAAPPMGISHQPGNPILNSTNMEVIWHGSFDDLFHQFLAQFKHYWQLAPLDPHEDPRSIGLIPNMKTFKDSAKVRFLCQECGNAWTSMKGRVIFWIMLQRHVQTADQGIDGYGSIHFKLFGQRCQKCNNERYQDPMWYPEEVVKVIKNVYHRVGQLHYGFQWPSKDATRRTGRPRTQHNSSHCQACAEGICNENRDDGTVNAIVNGLAKLIVCQPSPTSLPSAHQPQYPQSTLITGMQSQLHHQQQHHSTSSSPTHLDR